MVGILVWGVLYARIYDFSISLKNIQNLIFIKIYFSHHNYMRKNYENI